MQQHDVELLVDGQSAHLLFEATHWELALASAVLQLLQTMPPPQIELVSITTRENSYD